jgi:hypothetical protein
MKPPRPPRVETRRAKELEAELFERARAWIPSWGLDDDERDFGRALLKIAARFGSEVAERLDRAGEKTRLGFLDWLAVQGEAARPARLPVVFKLTDSAREAKPATVATRLQVEAAGTSVILETETEVLVLPRGLQALVGVDGATDAFFLAPPGLTSLAPLEPLPAQWQLKSFASNGATRLQLDPEQGLAPGMLVELGGRQYRITEVNQDIVTLDPPLAGDYAEQSVLTKVTALAPFDGAAHNRQEHALYIGHKELFDIEAAATIEITGARALAGMAWHYWGKRDPADETGWQALPLADAPAQAASGGIVLAKPKGAMEMLELVPGNESRWIRASVATVEPGGAPLFVDGFEIRVNCDHGAASAPGADPALAAPYAEGMANTTPLVLDNVFFPLGKDPRQFDAFYLGSQEAFSKKGAQVQLCFEIADPSFSSLTSLRSGPQPDLFLAGVAADGQLHLFQFLPLTGSLTRLANRVPLRPPAPAAPGAPAPQGSLSVALDPRPAYRVPLWLAGTDILVAVAAKGAVWLWREIAGAPNLGGWFPLDAVGPVADPATPIDGLVYLADGAAGLLCALRGGTLFVRDLNAPAVPWQAVETREGTAAVALATIAPICLEGGDLGNGTLAEGLVGVSTGNKLFAITLSGLPLKGTCSRLFDGIATTVAPVAVRRQPGLFGQLVAAAVDTDMPPRLVAGRFVPITFAPAEQKAVVLDPPPVAGAPLDMHFNANTLTVAVSLGDVPGSTALASWVPFAPTGLDELFKVQIPAALGAAAGAPTLLARHVLVPTSSSQVIVAGFDLARRLDLVAPMRTAIIAVDAADRLAIGDRLAIPTKGTGSAPDYKLETVNAAGVDFRGRALYEFNHQAIDKPLFVYPATPPPSTAKVVTTSPPVIEFDSGNPVPAKDDVLLIVTGTSTDLYVVKAFGSLKATLDHALPSASTSGMPVTYLLPKTSQALIRPMLDLDPLGSGNWPAALLDSVSLFFPGATPGFQAGTAYKVAGDRPELVVLAGHWLLEPPPVSPGNARFIVDGTVSGWVAQLGDTSTNPELSWEYWNGKGWWKLDVSSDGTLFLKKSGAVHFEVPADIASSDWAGKTNYWVRARLVGGDYGRETVSVLTEDLGNGKSKQTVDRSTEGIRAPSVARLRIAYSVCEAVQPGFVLVRGSGSVRDQSDANRTPGAMVEAFVPLALLLGRLSGAPAAAATANGCPPDCQCPGAGAGAAAAAASTASAAPAAAATATAAPALGRAIYLGFDAPLLGEPVNLLLLVEERPHDEFAPMSVEALVGDRFVPVVVNDATRALGESGVLSLAFPIAPTPRELFGQTLSWLRLAPASGPSADWKPKLLGAWLNGVWASAAETLTRELIGSSQGEPNLTLYLARPPVLRDTLELRVKEPLGEEEREALNAERAGQVLGALENQPGDWVLWQHVIDPGDEAPGARVYALDEATGEIRFGDGRHGRIPPIGRDSIMALAYRRTAPGAAGSAIVPGNAIAARTSLNLVSPIDGVEAVFAADQAAGGAPPEDAALVLRFGAARLRHRERALTARDVEDLVLESSPDIAQARCFPRQGFVQLVAVMAGADPVPGAARLRELHRMLLDAASPMLGARQALRIRGPALRRLRVDLRLRVASLDDAGAVAREARRRIAALFDSATGGVEGGGWPLGANPGEADIAAGLADVPRLQGIAAVELHEIGPDGGARPWPAALKGSELPWLAQDGVRIAFETAGVAA